MNAHFSFKNLDPPPTKAQSNRLLDIFAEHLSEDKSLDQIKDDMRITMGSACALLNRLERKYGAQAQ